MFIFVWICSESPFLEVCKLTDLMAVKVGRLTDLGAVLVEYCLTRSSKGLYMQGLTHVLGKLKLIIRAYKVGEFTDLLAIFESHCSLAGVGNFQRNDQGTFAEDVQSYRHTGFVLKTSVRWHQQVFTW